MKHASFKTVEACGPTDMLMFLPEFCKDLPVSGCCICHLLFIHIIHTLHTVTFMIVIYSNCHSVSKLLICPLQPASSWPCEDALPSLLRPLAARSQGYDVSHERVQLFVWGWKSNVSTQLQANAVVWTTEIPEIQGEPQIADINPATSMNEKSSAERLEALLAIDKHFRPSTLQAAFAKSSSWLGLGFPHRLQPCLVLPSNALLTDAPGGLDGCCSLGAVGCCLCAILDPTIRNKSLEAALEFQNGG